MTVMLEDLKTSLRVDGDEDDVLLRGYLESAKQYIYSAVGSDNQAFYNLESVVPLFDTATIALASGYYSARTALAYSQYYTVDLATDSIISQLRASYQVYCDEMGLEDGN